MIPNPRQTAADRPRARAWRGQRRVAGRTFRRHAADRAPRRAAARRGRPAGRAFTAACACRPRPPRTSPTASASELQRRGQAAHRARCRRGGAQRQLADPQHRHHHRGDRRATAAPPRPARDHQQPERGRDPVGDNADCEVIVAGGVVRTRDRGIVGEATVDFIRQFKVDIGLIGISGIEADGTLRDFDYREVQRGAGDHRAVAPGLAGRRPQQVQPAGDGRARRASTRSTACSPTRPPPAPFRDPAGRGRRELHHLRRRAVHRHEDASHEPSARPRPGHLQLAQHRVRRRTAASSRWRSANSPQHLSRSRAGSNTTPTRSGPDQLATAREALARAGLEAARHRRHRHHQPARDDRALGPPQRPAGAQRHRLAGPPRRAAVRAAARPGRHERAASQNAPACVIDAYFSATKLRWLLDHVSGAHIAAARGDLAFGTVDSWLIWQLTAARRMSPTSAMPRARCFSTCTTTLGRRAAGRCCTCPSSVLPKVLPSSASCSATPTPDLLGAPMPDRRHRRRPAERTLRPGLLQRRAWRRTPTAPAASC